MTLGQIAVIVGFVVALIAALAYLRRQNDRQNAEQARRDAAIGAAEQWYRRQTGFAGALETSAYFDTHENRWFVDLESEELVGRDSVEVLVKQDNTVDAGYWQAAQLAERWFRATHRLGEADRIYVGGELDPVEGTWSFLLHTDSRAINNEVRIGRDGSVAVVSDEDEPAA